MKIPNSNEIKSVNAALGIFILLAGCSSQEPQIEPDNPLYKNEKCYYEAISSPPHHNPTKVEKEIRYNRCNRN